MTRVRGADFSSHQDEQHFAAALEQGLGFAFVKLTEGTGYTYKGCGARVGRLLGRGIVPGVYHFLRPGSGAAQWRYFAAALSQIPGGDRVVVALDYEAAGTTDAEARAFIAAGRRAGYRVGCYSSAATHAYTRLGQAWRWVARWGRTAPPAGWMVWQFEPGRGGAPDWDLFNGGAGRLRRWWIANAGRGLYRVTVGRVGAHAITLGPFRTWRAAALHGLAYVVRHPRSARFRVAGPPMFVGGPLA